MKKPVAAVLIVLGVVISLLLVADILIRLDAKKASQETAERSAPAARSAPATQEPSQLPQADVSGVHLSVPQLIELLGDSNYSKRVAATEELKKRGRAALPLLQQAANNSGRGEVRARAKSIINQIESASQQVAQGGAGNVGAGNLGALQGMLGGQGLGGAAGGELGALMNQLLGQMRNPLVGQLGQPQGLQQRAGNQVAQVEIPALGGLDGQLGGLMNAFSNMNAMLAQMSQLQAAMLQQGGGLGGLGGLGEGDMAALNALLNQQLQQALQMANQGGVGAVNLPPPPPPGETSLNLLDSYGMRLGESADGLRVTSVRPGSAAANAALQVGDIITAVDGRQIAKLQDAKAVFENAEPGRPMQLEVTRRGDVITLTLQR